MTMIPRGEGATWYTITCLPQSDQSDLSAPPLKGSSCMDEHGAMQSVGTLQPLSVGNRICVQSFIYSYRCDSRLPLAAIERLAFWQMSPSNCPSKKAPPKARRLKAVVMAARLCGDKLQISFAHLPVEVWLNSLVYNQRLKVLLRAIRGFHFKGICNRQDFAMVTKARELINSVNGFVMSCQVQSGPEKSKAGDRIRHVRDLLLRAKRRLHKLLLGAHQKPVAISGLVEERNTKIWKKRFPEKTVCK
ncbi:hypothetical protein B0J14DRAFT_562321 [Halenospora varia]|nr:hypothetical protein B0J14DRAFT_562321 [Halenospora varia]